MAALYRATGASGTSSLFAAARKRYDGERPLPVGDDRRWILKMPGALRVHLLPEGLAAVKPPGDVAVVIDVLRASTTIAKALAAGATGVIPCQSVQDARVVAAAKRATEGDVVLGGEREGLPIDGFDLGNSPGEYTAESVGGKLVVFTTTNGTAALAACREQKRVLLAAAVNRRAVCELLVGEESLDVDLVCAGTDGEISREDVLVAGAIAEALVAHPNAQVWELSDTARLALAAWRDLLRTAGEREIAVRDHLAAELRDSRGGRNLIAIQHAADLAVAADFDSIDLTPELDRKTGRIAAATAGVA
jgi:2-phosphosulfolactate phosphatase